METVRAKLAALMQGGKCFEVKELLKRLAGTNFQTSLRKIIWRVREAEGCKWQNIFTTSGSELDSMPPHGLRSYG